jgi:hypothetical protein
MLYVRLLVLELVMASECGVLHIGLYDDVRPLARAQGVDVLNRPSRGRHEAAPPMPLSPSIDKAADGVADRMLHPAARRRANGEKARLLRLARLIRS